METSQAEITMNLTQLDKKDLDLNEPIRQLFDECLSFISASSFIM